MSGLSQSDLAGIRACEVSFQPDSITITRTGQTTSVRIDADTGRLHLEGMPHFLPLPRWLFSLPDTTNLKAGDAVSVTGKGSYAIIEVLNPTSYSVATNAIALQTQNADGSLAMTTNWTVTFRDPTNNARTVTAAVYIQWITAQLKQLYGLTGDWRVFWNETLRYPDGTQIGDGHHIIWNRTPNPFPGKYASLQKPRHEYPGLIPLVCATFEEG